jgi:hypothetical protein
MHDLVAARCLERRAQGSARLAATRSLVEPRSVEDVTLVTCLFACSHAQGHGTRREGEASICSPLQAAVGFFAICSHLLVNELNGSIRGRVCLPSLQHRCILIPRWDALLCAACNAARDGGVTSRNVSTELGMTEEDRHDLVESPCWEACQPASLSRYGRARRNVLEEQLLSLRRYS